MSITDIILIAITVLLAGYCVRLKLHQEAPKENLLHQNSPKLQISNNDIMQYIREAAGSFMSTMVEKGVSFSIKCAPESMMGWTDTEIIDNILLLLLTDILRNPTAGSKVTLNAYTNKSYDQVFLRISDNSPKRVSISYLIVHQLVLMHHGKLETEYHKRQGNTIIIQLPIKKDAYSAEDAKDIQPSTFHIPTNIELNVPTIELPSGFEDGEKSIGAMIHEAYVSADQEFVQRAIRCINEHIMDSDYDREAFAVDMGSSVSTLYNKIRAITGKSITNFVRDIRIKAACRMARENPDLRVSDLAYQVGFKDPKYFATSFKRVMGMQPKEYISHLRSKGH